MRANQFMVMPPILLLVLLIFVYVCDANAALRVGASAASVSPQQQVFLAGYDRNRRSDGEHDPVFAKAVVVTDAHSAIAIVVIDCIGLLYPDVVRIRERAGQLLNGGLLSPEQIIVTSTHTHAGPDVAGLWGAHIFSNGRDEAYIDFLVETAARQVVNALAQLQPATLRVASAQAELSWVENRSEPGLLDNTITTVQFINPTGRSIATLTNFPCHPTVLGPENHLLSSDYVGGFYQAMDQRHGGANLFLQGAIGGWVQPLQGDRSFTLATDYGELLAQISTALLLEAESIRTPALEFTAATLDLPLENFGFKLLMFLGVLDREIFAGHLRTEVAWFSIGGIQFATHPGETSPAYSLATRELMGNPDHSVILGLGLDALGYILKPEYFETPEEFPHAEYLTTVSVGPHSAPELMAALAKIIPDQSNL